MMGENPLVPRAKGQLLSNFLFEAHPVNFRQSFGETGRGDMSVELSSSQGRLSHP